MRRIPSRELLDDHAGTRLEVLRSLEDLRFVNRYFGGVAATKLMMERVAHASGRVDFSWLEVAAGTGDLPRSVGAALRSRGINLRWMLLDRRATHMTMGALKVVGDCLDSSFSRSQRRACRDGGGNNGCPGRHARVAS